MFPDQDSSNPYASPQAELDPANASDISAKTWVPVCAVLSFAIGVTARLIRPYFTGAVHYDAIGAVAIMALLQLVLLVRFWRLGVHTAAAWTQLGMAASWAAFGAGYLLAHGAIWEDVLGVVLVCWLISAGLAVLVWVVRARLIGDLS